MRTFSRTMPSSFVRGWLDVGCWVLSVGAGCVRASVRYSSATSAWLKRPSSLAASTSQSTLPSSKSFVRNCPPSRMTCSTIQQKAATQVTVTLLSSSFKKKILMPSLWLAGRGIIFSDCLFLLVFVCSSVCLSVSKITQKHVHGFGWNVACRQMSGHGRTD